MQAIAGSWNSWTENRIRNLIINRISAYLSINNFQNMVTGGRLSPLLQLFFLLLPLLFWGCMDLRIKTEDPVPANLPDSFSIYLPTEAATTPWWLNFNSPELNLLISNGIGKTVLTNIITFMPLCFVPGVMGKIFRSIPSGGGSGLSHLPD